MFQKFLVPITGLIFCGLINPAEANSVQSIKHTKTGQDVYEIVLKDDSKASSETPGLYSIDAQDGKLELLVKGNVMGAHRGFNGVLHHVSYLGSDADLTSPVFLIIDGKIHLVARKTSAKSKPTIIVLDGKDFPMVDILSAQKVQVPIIPSIDKVQSISLPSRKTKEGIEYQSFLFSIDQPHMMGTGLTFLVSVAHQADKTVLLDQKSQVISYEYYSKKTLSKLTLGTDAPRVFAPLIVQQLHSKLNEIGKHPLTDRWRLLIADYYKILYSENFPELSSQGIKGIPSYDFIEKKISLDNIPVEIIKTIPTSMGASYLVQAFNPANSKWYIHVVRSKELSDTRQPSFSEYTRLTTRFLEGKVESLSAQEYLTFPASESIGSGGFFLGVQQQGSSQGYFVASNADSSPRFVNLSLALKDIKQLNFWSDVVAYQGTSYHYLYVSYRMKQKKEETLVYILKNKDGDAQNELVLVKQERLLPMFMTADEIRARIYNANGFYAFDSSAKTLGVDAYKRSIEGGRRKVHINLKKPISQKEPAEVFIDHMNETAIVKDFMVYRQYDADGAALDVSGFYLLDPRDKNKVLHWESGNIAFQRARKSPDKYYLDSSLLKFELESKAIPESYVYIVPYSKDRILKTDSNKNEMAVATDLALVITPASAFAYSVSPLMMSFRPKNYSVKDIVAMKIVQGKRLKENTFTLLAFVKGADPTSQGREIIRIHTHHFSMKVEKYDTTTATQEERINKYSLSGQIEGILEGTANLGDVKERLKSDANGDYYWIIDPTVSKDSPGFIVQRLADPKKPLKLNDSTVRLRMDEVYEGIGSGFGLPVGRWGVHSRPELLQRFHRIEDTLREWKKWQQEHADKEISVFEANPHYKSFLLSLSDPEKRKNHLKRQVILLNSSEEKEQLIKAMAYQLAEVESPFSIDFKNNRRFNFFTFDVTSTASEVVMELEKIAETSNKNAQMLFVDAAHLMTSTDLVVDYAQHDGFQMFQEDKETSDKDAEAIKAHTSRLLLLATDGKAKTLPDFSPNKNYTPSVPTVIFATLDEWDRLQTYFNKEKAAGVFNQFYLNHQFHTTSWTLLPAKSPKASKEIRRVAQVPISAEEKKIFPLIDRTLQSAAVGELKGKQKIIIVPEGLKPLMEKLVLGRWLSANPNIAGAWSYKNNQLSVFKMGFETVEKKSQPDVLKNFASMRAMGEVRNVVLYGTLENIVAAGRPKLDAGNSDPYTWNDIKKSSDIFEQNGGSVEVEGIEKDSAEHDEHKVEPHLMWMIASEGNRIIPRFGKDWKFEESFQRQYATILIGTQNELDQIEQDMKLESRYFHLKDHVEIVRLEPPSDAIKYDLLDSMFQRPEVRMLEYSFEQEGATPEEARRQLLYHIVNRTNQIAESKKLESTEAFINVFVKFHQQLLEDQELRRGRKITKSYIERFFPHVFSLPINPDNEPPTDPLRRMREGEKFVQEWREAGMDGSSDLKRRVIHTVLSQTRPVSSGRSVPSSFIFYGGTGSGKTFVFETLFKALNLKMYDSAKPSNDDAEAIIVQVKHIHDKDGTGPDRMSLKHVMEDLEDLVAQPKGHRAYILFDDIHKAASKEIYSALMGFINRFFDHPQGMITVRKKGSPDLREVPVQNITLAMTLNPEDDKEYVRKFTGGNTSDLKSMVIAALGRKGEYKIEESFIARWTEIINMDRFPRAAKVPALVSRIRYASKDGQNLVLVEPQAIDKFVDAHPVNANAREFLDPAAAALTSFTPSTKDTSLYIVVPNEQAPNVQGRGLDPTSLVKSARDLTHTVPVRRDDPSSQLRLLSFVLQNFRVNLFNHLVLEGQNDDALNMTMANKKDILRRNFLFGTATHLAAHRNLPTSELALRPDDFNYLSRVQFDDLYKMNSEKKTKFFPMDFYVREVSLSSNYEGFQSGRYIANLHRSQQDILSDYVHKTEKLMNKILALYLRFDNVPYFQRVRSWNEVEQKAWFTHLKDKEPQTEYRSLVREVLSTYSQFYIDLLDPDVTVDLPRGDHLEIYDTVRLFTYVLDKAITRLPWGLVTKFTQDIVDQSKDLSMQRNEFKNFLFDHQLSPFAMITPDLVGEVRSELVENSPEVKTLEERLKREKERYKPTINSHFQPSGSPGQSCDILFKPWR